MAIVTFDPESAGQAPDTLKKTALNSIDCDHYPLHLASAVLSRSCAGSWRWKNVSLGTG